MSGFRFNFAVADEKDEDQTDADIGQVEDGKGLTQWIAASEVDWIGERELQQAVNVCEKVEHTFGSYHLKMVSASSVEQYVLAQQKDTCAVVSALTSHSDLVTGQYEGGLKVWECSIDLCQYLVEDDAPRVAGSRVLELGCGAGLPGLLAAKMGASSVHFQDYNKEVLQTYTMANVYLNKLDKATGTFFSGDWASFTQLAQDRGHSYDLILTAETIYNTSSYSKLHDVFTSLLTKSGTVLLAAKTTYFGVGGSLASFTRFVESKKQLQMQVCKHIEADVPRQIVKITRT